MSDLWQGFENAKGPKPLSVPAGADFEELPLLSQLLSGQLDKAGIMWEKPPYKLLLWLENAHAKWCCTAKDKWPKLWGTSSGLAEGLLGVEKAIREGRCEWQRPEGAK